MTYGTQTLIVAVAAQEVVDAAEREQEARPRVFRTQAGLWSWAAGAGPWPIYGPWFADQGSAFRSAQRYAVRRARARAEEFDGGW